MTTLPQENTIIQYIADGVTTIYNFPFYIFLTTDIQVYVTLAGAMPVPAHDLQPNGVAYTVQNAGNPTYAGGTITFQSGYVPPASAIITIVQAIQFTITTNFSAATTINGANLDSAFARITAMCQQLASFYNYKGFQYPINAYTPADNPSVVNPVEPNVLPLLANGYTWMGQNGAVISVLVDQNPDFSTFSSQLANQSSGGNGTSLVGYFDQVNSVPETLKTFLDNLPTWLPPVITPTISSVFAADAQVSHGTIYADAGTANTYSATGVPAYAAYALGTTILLQIANTNTGASTLNLNSHGAKNITYNTGQVIAAGDLKVGMIAQLVYDGTNFQLLNPAKYLVVARAYVTASQTLAGTTNAVVALNNNSTSPGGFDNTSAFNLTTHQFNPQVPGYYAFTGSLEVASLATGDSLQIEVRKNGGAIASCYFAANANPANATANVSDRIFMNGSTDYLDLYWINSSANSYSLSNAQPNRNYLSVNLIN